MERLILHINYIWDAVIHSYNNRNTGLHLDASDGISYRITICPYVVRRAQEGWRFTTENATTTTVPLSFDHANNTTLGGSLTFGTDFWNLSNDDLARICFGSSGTTH